MNIYKQFCLIISILISVVSNAQEEKKYNFQYGAGALAPILYVNSTATLGDNSVAGAYAHFQYILTGKENNTVTIGTHPILAGLYSNNNSVISKRFNFNAPLVLEYNLGNNASAASTNRFGLYIGGGFTFLYAYYSIEDNSSSINDNGPIGNFGIRGHMIGRDYSLNLFVVKSLKFDNIYWGGAAFTVALKKTEQAVSSKSSKRGNIFGNGGGFFEFFLPRDNNKF